MTTTKQPMVSICCMAKDLETYIADAIKSFLAQQTNFDIEIILSDDCSTDKTLEVCRSYQQQHPDKIKILTATERLGLERNFIKTMQACTGKYIAFCDGDDYWTDPLKLQKQVDYLEQHPECALVCSDYDYISQKGEFIPSEYKKNWYGKTFDLYDNIREAVATTLTTVIRKSTLDPLLDNITLEKHPFIWDTVLWTFCLQHGNGYFYPEKLAIRRVLSTGEYTTRSLLDRSLIDAKCLVSINSFAKDKETRRFINDHLYATNILIAKEKIKQGKKAEAKKGLMQNALTWEGMPAFKNNIKYLYRFLKMNA